MQATPNNGVGNTILEGWIVDDALAAELGYDSTRSIDRLTKGVNGLPYIVVNRKKWFRIEGVRQWFADREIQRNQTGTKRRHRASKAA